MRVGAVATVLRVGSAKDLAVGTVRTGFDDIKVESLQAGGGNPCFLVCEPFAPPVRNNQST